MTAVKARQCRANSAQQLSCEGGTMPHTCSSLVPKKPSQGTVWDSLVLMMLTLPGHEMCKQTPTTSCCCITGNGKHDWRYLHNRLTPTTRVGYYPTSRLTSETEPKTARQTSQACTHKRGSAGGAWNELNPCHSIAAYDSSCFLYDARITYYEYVVYTMPGLKAVTAQPAR